MLNKVPLVTFAFWVIKVLATTVGETGADYLNFNLVFGLTTTSLAAVVLLGFLWLQLRQDRYVPWIYWVTVVFLSIVGTLITDNLSDNFRVSLYVSSAVFAVAFAVTFILWYRSEKTLSIHDITNPGRERIYWLAILFTFALGTAAGDLLPEQMALGYVVAGLIFGGAIALIILGYYAGVIGPVLAFWSAYVDKAARRVDGRFSDPSAQRPWPWVVDNDRQRDFPHHHRGARRLSHRQQGRCDRTG